MHDLTAQQLAQLGDSESGVCNFEPGLVKPRPLTTPLKELVELELDMDMSGVVCMTSATTRCSPVLCTSVRDVVLISDGSSIVAGYVWAHFEVGAIPMSLSVVP